MSGKKSDSKAINIVQRLELQASVRKILCAEIRSIAPFVKKYSSGMEYNRDKQRQFEKDRVRRVGKVRLAGLRLLTALDELDDDDRDFVAYLMDGGDDSKPAVERRGEELRGLQKMKAVRESLERLAAMKPSRLPPKSIKVRPELLIAVDVSRALQRAGIAVTAADTGAAADIFRAIANEAGVNGCDNPRYWLNKAKKIGATNPEI